MFRSRNNTVFWQVLALIILWILLKLYFSPKDLGTFHVIIRQIPVLITTLILIPLNSLVLLPSLCFKKRYVSYFLASIISILICLFICFNDLWPWSEWFDNTNSRPFPHFDRNERIPPGAPMISYRWIERIAPVLIFFLINTLIELSKYANQKERRFLQLEKEKASSDLHFLKSQINPHFLFNAMNNLYSLAVVQSPHTAESIMQLSEMLRYMVYDSDGDLVSLKDEIQYINNFVKLKLLKESKGLNVKLDLDQANKEIILPPLLFIPFVENAFKHSHFEDISEGFIDIKLKIDDNVIMFYVTNSIPKKQYTKDKVGGVGLVNIKKRLSMLYPNDQHSLVIKNDQSNFSVTLSLTR